MNEVFHTNSIPETTQDESGWPFGDLCYFIGVKAVDLFPGFSARVLLSVITQWEVKLSSHVSPFWEVWAFCSAVQKGGSRRLGFLSSYGQAFTKCYFCSLKKCIYSVNQLFEQSISHCGWLCLFHLLLQVFYVSDLFKPKTKTCLPPPPIRKEILSPVDIIERNNHHNMV